jgi:hypothetical protein
MMFLFATLGATGCGIPVHVKKVDASAPVAGTRYVLGTPSYVPSLTIDKLELAVDSAKGGTGLTYAEISVHQAGGFKTDDVVEGSNSHAVARVFSVDGAGGDLTLYVGLVHGRFVAGETLTCKATGATAIVNTDRVHVKSVVFKLGIEEGLDGPPDFYEVSSKCCRFLSSTDFSVNTDGKEKLSSFTASEQDKLKEIVAAAANLAVSIGKPGAKNEVDDTPLPKRLDDFVQNYQRLVDSVADMQARHAAATKPDEAKLISDQLTLLQDRLKTAGVLVLTKDDLVIVVKDNLTRPVQSDGTPGNVLFGNPKSKDLLATVTLKRK